MKHSKSLNFSKIWNFSYFYNLKYLKPPNNNSNYLKNPPFKYVIKILNNFLLYKLSLLNFISEIFSKNYR